MKLEIKNLSFSYKNKEILNNISFEVYSGTLLSILGANGAGKTTLIKCINGILNYILSLVGYLLFLHSNKGVRFENTDYRL